MAVWDHLYNTMQSVLIFSRPKKIKNLNLKTILRLSPTKYQIYLCKKFFNDSKLLLKAKIIRAIKFVCFKLNLLQYFFGDSNLPQNVKFKNEEKYYGAIKVLPVFSIQSHININCDFFFFWVSYCIFPSDK